MNTRGKMVIVLLVIALLGLMDPNFAIAQSQIKVNCTKGQSVQAALDKLTGPGTITVTGTCNENVLINKDDVTIVAGAGGAIINGPNSQNNTILVSGFRTLIDGLNALEVTGGRNGISVVGGLTVRNCTVRNTGSNGIVFYHGGRGLVDNCVVQNNARHGILIEGAGATVTNSNISFNDGVGVMVVRSGSARIGIPDTAQQYAGNTISSNKSNGIEFADGGSGAVGGNTISGNGTNSSAVWGRYGVAIYWATATLVGKNSINGNYIGGVFVQNSNVTIGDAGWGLPVTGSDGNSITENGPNGGITGFLGTSLSIRYASIHGNNGNGLTLSTRSTARINDSNVTDNTGYGILLTLGGGLLLPPTPVTVTGNGLVGLQCLDSESSFAGDPSGISDVSSTCTGF